MEYGWWWLEYADNDWNMVDDDGNMVDDDWNMVDEDWNMVDEDWNIVDWILTTIGLSAKWNQIFNEDICITDTYQFLLFQSWSSSP